MDLSHLHFPSTNFYLFLLYSIVFHNYYFVEKIYYVIPLASSSTFATEIQNAGARLSTLCYWRFEKLIIALASFPLLKFCRLLYLLFRYRFIISHYYCAVKFSYGRMILTYLAQPREIWLSYSIMGADFR